MIDELRVEQLRLIFFFLRIFALISKPLGFAQAINI
jgi:hypothetical protein